MSRDFSGKVAVVTGGASGIGAAVVRQFALRGASVMIADVNHKGAEMVEELRTAGGQVAFHHTDVTDASQVREMVEEADGQFGGLDIVVNCAGIFPRGSLLDTTGDLWDRIMSVNLKGVFHVCQAAVPKLMDRGGGSIINIGSLNAAGGAPNLLAYSASKGGVLTLTMNLAGALSTNHIRVNCVHPGWVLTEGEMEVQKAMGQSDDWIERAGSRLIRPEAVASSVLFLASDAADQITGQAITVDGGLSIWYP